MTKSDKVKQDNEDYKRLVKESYEDKKPSSTLRHARYSSSTPQPSNSGCGWILAVIGIICIIFLFHGCSIGGGSGYSAPSNPTTPKGYAEYERPRIIHNIHKNEPNIKVRYATVNRAGTLRIYTNYDTDNQNKIRKVWHEIYDDNGNTDYDCSNVELWGKVNMNNSGKLTPEMLCKGDAQQSGNLTYGSVTDNPDEENDGAPLGQF